jgi:hypothetical protein
MMKKLKQIIIEHLRYHRLPLFRNQYQDRGYTQP